MDMSVTKIKGALEKKNPSWTMGCLQSLGSFALKFIVNLVNFCV